METQSCTLVWLRRDLRLEDHAALATALQFPEPIQPVFVFDTTILDEIPGAGGQSLCPDRRVGFIHASVHELATRLSRGGGHLITMHGDPRHLIPELVRELGATRLVFARDDEPIARQRDDAVCAMITAQGCAAIVVKDQCIFERDEVLTGAGRPFSVFTPYRNAWQRRLSPQDIAPRVTGAGPASVDTPPQPELTARLHAHKHLPRHLRGPLPTLADMGFDAGNLADLPIAPGETAAQRLFDDFQPRMGRYRQNRDFPGVKGPSYLSVHLRFGTISVRELVRFALKTISDNPSDAEGATTWLSELIWRDFYMQILHHHPHVVTRSFRAEYDAIAWEEGPAADALFLAWCEGRTGYPLVDAGMRQLNISGYMHNRMRMVTASFLTKDLGIDWRRGEHYFAWKLNDFDLSANNGGWQWAASTGCDAQPYFRIFNPVSQSERFDPQGTFIRRYVPEIAGLPDRFIHAPWDAPPLVLEEHGIVLGKTYPFPVVKHDEARQQTLRRFSVVKAARSRAD
jgi:deoxyribodipyrimidine photo-lyase